MSNSFNVFKCLNRNQSKLSMLLIGRAIENSAEAIIESSEAKRFIKKNTRVKRGFLRIRIRIKNPLEIAREVKEKAREGLENGREFTKERARK